MRVGGKELVITADGLTEGDAAAIAVPMLPLMSTATTSSRSASSPMSAPGRSRA